MINNNVIAGIKPTGSIHIGNYCGAIRPFIQSSTQNQQDHYLMIADLHAITSTVKSKDLVNCTNYMAKALYALTRNYPNIYVYKQSDIEYLNDIYWVYTNQVTIPLLERMHAYKASSKKDAGLCMYAVLMAADVQSLRCSHVYVGQDQLQHIELIRTINRRLHSEYNYRSIDPKPVISMPQVLLGIDGRKMSKSYNNVIDIFASEAQIRDLVNKIKTTSCPRYAKKDYSSCTLYHIYKGICQNNNIVEMYESGNDWSSVKSYLAKSIHSYLAPYREAYEDVDSNTLHKTLKSNARRVTDIVYSYRNSLYRALGLHEYNAP